MDKTNVIGLNGHVEQYQLDDEAYEVLRSYLDRAADRLRDDPGRADVLGDLEQSIGDKLAVLLGSDHRLVTATDMNGVLEQIGAVDAGDDRATADDPPQLGARRRLHRIREGQKLAGVCTGLADYAEVGVDWVRTGFVLASVVTAGLFTLVYVALVFIMPVDSRRDLRAPGGR